MSGKTGIAYLNSCWNVVTGCTPVSAACDFCWAKRYAGRHLGDWKALVETRDGSFVDGLRSRRFDEVRCHPERLDQPLHWRKPRRIGVAFTGDIFHEDVPTVFIGKVWSRMLETPRHTYMLLTKRAERQRQVVTRFYDEMADKGLRRADHIWIGVSVENQATADERVPLLLQTPAAVRYVSIEPMLGPVDLNRACYGVGHVRPSPEVQARQIPFTAGILDLVILGAESGPHRRYCDPTWMLDVVRQCRAAGVKCFVKQIHIGLSSKTQWFHVSHDPAEWPEELRVREVPA